MLFRLVPKWLLLVLASSVPVFGQEVSQRKWLTGEAFQRQLESRFGIAWSAEPLRQKLKTLAEHTQVANWLDRRIDPTQQPEITIPMTELSRCFELIAQRIDAGVCYVGPVVYVGPPSVTAKLATLAELRATEAAEMPADSRARLTRVEAWSWEELTTPRELLAELGRQANLTIVDVEQIPHDLWPAVELPPLSYTDRLSLVLAGFDLTFALDPSGKSVRLMPMPERPLLVRKYPVPGDIESVLAKLRSALPTMDLQREGTRIVAKGRSEDHRLITRLLAGQNVRAPAPIPGRTVYTMKGPSLLGQVLKTLQVQVGLNISLDAKAQSKLRDRIEFDVKEASLEELMTAVLRDTGLQYQLDGNTLRVFGS